jgi:hypothetical protein
LCVDNLRGIVYGSPLIIPNSYFNIAIEKCNRSENLNCASEEEIEEFYNGAMITIGYITKKIDFHGT